MALLGNILGSGSGNVLDRESRILSSSNPARVRLGKSRKYLDDYNKFGSVFTLKNFVIQFTKGACLPLLGITKELEAFNKRQLQAYERREEFREEFDWEAAVKKQLCVCCVCAVLCVRCCVCVAGCVMWVDLSLVLALYFRQYL
jgi:hypothetical protein